MRKKIKQFPSKVTIEFTEEFWIQIWIRNKKKC
jgi:hypothetical protein